MAIERSSLPEHVQKIAIALENEAMGRKHGLDLMPGAKSFAVSGNEFEGAQHGGSVKQRTHEI